jgi:ABC-type branched-subunit amino acid transport system ATPase component
LSEQIFPGLDFVWLFLIGGAAVILILLTDPDGLVAMNLKAARATEGQSKLIWLRPEPALLKLIAILRRQSWTPGLLRMREPTKETFAPMPERVDVEVATLELSNLTVRYGGTTALDAVSLVVRPGELVGLIGPNGAGKTSLIDAVTGFTPIADGEVRLNGVPIDGLPAYRRAQLGVCRSFQNLELFESGTVHDNLLTAADPRDLRSYFKELLRPSQSALSPLMIAAVHHFGLVDALDTKAEDLSFGVRKRTAIARTVAIGPSVLLLDEPAAGLDDAQSRELALTIKRIATAWGLGILLIEHNMAFVMGLCDRIAVLDFGHMIAQGTPTEIRSHPEVIAAYLGTPDTEVAA